MVDTTKQSTYVGKDTIGWLCWWTISSGDYDVEKLEEAAKDAGLGSYVLERIRGRDLRAAFLAATRTGRPGIPVPTTRDTTARLISKEADPKHIAGGGDVRALVYQETRPSAANVAEIVEAKTAALLFANSANDTIDVQWARWAKDDQRIQHVVDGMRMKLGAKIGTMDDGRVRSVVLGWLKTRHRVSVRGTGGVYFVPAPTSLEDAKLLQEELVAMRQWLASTRSPFSIVAMNERGALSLDDFVHDAISEIEEELGDIAEKLAKWSGTETMNAGSRMFSSSTQITRMEELKGKITALQGSLGEAIGVVVETFDLLRRKADGMLESSSAEVAASKLHQAEAKKQRKVERAEKAAEKQGKKSGTAAKRSKKRQVE